jgi:hypothetical protein
MIQLWMCGCHETTRYWLHDDFHAPLNVARNENLDNVKNDNGNCRSRFPKFFRIIWPLKFDVLVENLGLPSGSGGTTNFFRHSLVCNKTSSRLQRSLLTLVNQRQEGKCRY